MKDYYKILGVKEEASGEEIRGRYVELAKLYHPDLKESAEGSEKIKEINEAYEVLKDDPTRMDYDIERTLKKSIKKRFEQKRDRKFSVKRIVIPTGILTFFLIIGLVLFRSPRVHIQSKPEVIYEISKITEKKPVPPIPPPEMKPEVRVEMETQKEIKKVMPGKEEPKLKVEHPPKSVIKLEVREKRGEAPPPPREEEKPKREPTAHVALKAETTIKPEPSVSKEVPKEGPKEVLKEVPEEVSKKVIKEVSKVIPKEVPKEVAKEVPKEIHKEVPPKIPKKGVEILPQEIEKVEKPKPIGKEPLSPPSSITNQEIKQFFSLYIDQYANKDTEGFFSLFSLRAIQNQKDDLEGIKKIYTHFFNQSEELRYHLEEMEIEIYQNGAKIKSRYQVTQILGKGGEKLWRGRIHWVLVKEEGVLRIITLNYQNDKSP